jgi:hypothetical protein
MVLVLQASFGTLVILRVLPGLQGSILLLCGPGLVLGGGLSFVVFQIAGRGAVGAVATLLLGAFSAFLTSVKSGRSSGFTSTGKAAAHLAGLALLVLSSQFPWLFLVSLSILVFAMFLESRLAQNKVAHGVAAALLATLSFLATAIRGANWSLITDDYLFFEALALHLTRSGPLATWGTSDFSQYHWLSYGWSGLLNLFALTPDTLVTLTRVVPLFYALVISSSVLYCVRQFKQRSMLSAFTVFPAWVFLSAIRLDWSGTSTAAAIAVLAALCSLLLAVANSESHFGQRLVLYVLFGFLILFTKAPSVLVFPLLALTTEVLLYTRRHKSNHRTTRLFAASISSGLFGLTTLPLFSAVVGNFSVEWGEQRGDELSRNGLITTLVTLTGRNLWIVGVILATWLSTRSSLDTTKNDSYRLALAFSPAFAVAVAMDAIVVGVSNTNEYFSGPFYFLSLIPLLAAGSNSIGHGGLKGVALRSRVWILVLTLAIASSLLVSRLTKFAPINLSFVSVVLTDSRILYCAALIVALIMSRRRLDSRLSGGVLPLLLLVACVGTASTVERLIGDGIRPTYTEPQVNVLLGPPDARTVAHWLRDNSEITELVATNYLRDKSGDLSSDYSLAAWSRREFLVLGPSLSFSSVSTDEAIRWSEEFGRLPSAESAAYLKSQDVKWYIVDLDKTPVRSWEPFAETVVMTWRFWVLRLR